MYTLGQVNGRDTLSIMPLTLSKTRFLTHTHLALVCVGTLCDLEDEDSVVTLSLSLGKSFHLDVGHDRGDGDGGARTYKHIRDARQLDVLRTVSHRDENLLLRHAETDFGRPL